MGNILGIISSGLKGRKEGKEMVCVCVCACVRVCAARVY